MAFKIAKFDSSVFTHTLITDTVLSGSGGGTATVDIDMTQGDAGSVLFIDLDNQWSGGRVYFKMTFTNTAPVVGTSVPDLIIPVNASTGTRWLIPEGIPFTNLSMWAVTSGLDNATTAPSGNFLATITTT